MNHRPAAWSGGEPHSTSEETGRYQASGRTLTLYPDGAAPNRYDLKLEAGPLKLGNIRFFRCS